VVDVGVEPTLRLRNLIFVIDTYFRKPQHLLLAMLDYAFPMINYLILGTARLVSTPSPIINWGLARRCHMHIAFRVSPSLSSSTF